MSAYSGQPQSRKARMPNIGGIYRPPRLHKGLTVIFGFRKTLVLSLFTLAACEARVSEVRRYAGVPVAYVVPLAKGDLAIANRNGSIWVDTAGTAGQISVTARPFASGPDDQAAEAAAVASLSTLSLTVAPDGRGGVDVEGGGDDTQGFDLAVHLPYPFGGQLTIAATNGNVHYVGSSGGRGATIRV